MCGANAASVLPVVIPAVSGLLGALIGGGATILANHLTSKAAAARSRQEFEDRTQHERTERLLAKGEEVVSLLGSAGEWYTRVIDAALTPGHDKLLEYPPEPSRIEALVLAYFHDIDPQNLYDLRMACAALESSVVEMLETKFVPVSYQPVHNGLVTTAIALQRAVLKGMQFISAAEPPPPKGQPAATAK